MVSRRFSYFCRAKPGNIRVGRALVAAVVVSLAGVADAAEAPRDTLVTRTSSGDFGPGAATSWSTDKNAVVFALAPGVDANTVAQVLRERLATAKVSVVGESLHIEGVAKSALLGQLASLSLSGESDPLADLAGLGVAVVAMQAPEGGGSIRASRPAAVSQMWVGSEEHDVAERFEAQVVDVQRETFPHVRLKLRIIRGAQKGGLKEQLRRGRTIEGPVMTMMITDHAKGDGSINVQNLAAFYLRKGDKVQAHARLGDDHALFIDWLERL